MRKIKANFDKNDRIVCISVPGKHQFFYQPAGTNERIWLFVTKDYSGSIFNYFRTKGRNMSDMGFSLTIKELYEFKEYHNHKLVALMERIPSQVEYVIRERSENEINQNKRAVSCIQVYRDLDHDDERAA